VVEGQCVWADPQDRLPAFDMLERQIPGTMSMGTQVAVPEVCERG
jgi:hypothetical protein